jgi:hypothetical protein
MLHFFEEISRLRAPMQRRRVMQGRQAANRELSPGETFSPELACCHQSGAIS